MCYKTELSWNTANTAQRSRQETSNTLDLGAGQAGHLLLSWVQRSSVKLGGLGVVAVAGLLLSVLGRWGLMHKAFKVSLSYIMKYSLRDNKKVGEGGEFKVEDETYE